MSNAMSMQEHNYKVGDELLVFGCPVDKTEPEGVATIVAMLNTAHYYTVRFENEPDTTYDRFIH